MCSIKGRTVRIANVRIRAGKVRIPYTLSSQIFSIFFYALRDLCVLSSHINISTVDASFSMTFSLCVLLIPQAFIRNLLSLVLIRNLGMKSDHVLFHNSCSSNVCPFGSQTCCQSMKNLMKQVGLSFEDFFFSCKNPGLSQRER